MDAKEFLKRKVIELGYKDFLDYTDCRLEKDQASELPKWMEEYHQTKLITFNNE